MNGDPHEGPSDMPGCPHICDYLSMAEPPENTKVRGLSSTSPGIDAGNFADA
jgi:hypothetical protein